MSRKQYNSRNNIANVLTFQKSGATSSFDPTIQFSGGNLSRRVSWRLFNGILTTQVAGSTLSYNGFSLDSNIRTIQVRADDLKNISNFDMFNDNLYGHLDLSPLSGLSGIFSVQNNPQLTKITNPVSPNQLTLYGASDCNIIGNLDFTTFSNLSGNIFLSNNSNLTGLTFSSSSSNINSISAPFCNLTGTLDLSPLSGLGNDLQLSYNPNLNNVINPPSSRDFSQYDISNCDLQGTLDLRPLSGTQQGVYFDSNSGLTNILHSTASNSIGTYSAKFCDLTGNLDLSPFTNIGGRYLLSNNPNLTGVTFSYSTNNIGPIWIHNCKLTGTLDLSPLSKLGGVSATSVSEILLYNNLNLTNIIFPISTQFFRNNFNSTQFRAFSLQSCNLDYIDFTKLSGATLVSGVTQGRATIELQNNGMISADVNHILVDFSGNATFNPTGWSNVNLNISGTNGAPNTSSGGYNGIAARNFLTGSPYNWTITHS